MLDEVKKCKHLGMILENNGEVDEKVEDEGPNVYKKWRKTHQGWSR